MSNNRIILTAKTADEMIEIGSKMGEAAFPNAFIALFGDLGAGKTTLVKGISIALGIEDEVTSPTFTIVCHHRGKSLDLEHFDAYRISSVDELIAIGFDDYLANGGLVVMEWCENVPDAVPNERLEVYIHGSGSDERTLDICAYGDCFLRMIEVLKQ